MTELSAETRNLIEMFEGKTWPTIIALAQVGHEREAQDLKWGEQNHPDGTGRQWDMGRAEVAKGLCDWAAETGTVSWRHILDEEIAEAYEETDPVRLREELKQVAAVAVAWIEAIDRRG